MKKTFYSFFAVLVAVVLGAGVASAQTLYSYTVSDQDKVAGTYDAIGGTMTIGVKDKTTTVNGVVCFKLDGDYTATTNKYMQPNLDEALVTGDEIIISAAATSTPTGADYGVSIYEDGNLITTLYLQSGKKNTFEDLTYTVGPDLAGKTSFRIYRAAGKSTCVSSVTVKRSKELSSLSYSVVGATVDGEAISAADVATLASTKSVSLDNEYRYAPKVTFTVVAHSEFTDGTSEDVNSTVNASVEEVDETFVATATIDGEVYTLIVKKEAVVLVTDIVPITGATTWNWTGASSADITPDAAGEIFFANYGPWADGFNAAALKSNSCAYLSRPGNKCFQGKNLVFSTTVPGTVTLKYSNTGNRNANENLERTVKVNGVVLDKVGSLNGTAITVSTVVEAGEVVIDGEMLYTGGANDIRIFEIVFTPGQDLTVGEAGICTFAPLFDVEIPSGVEAWVLASKDDVVDNEVTLTKIDNGYISAGAGVILQAAAGKYTFAPASAVAATETLLVGTGAAGKTLAAGEGYILGNGANGVGLYVAGEGTLGAFKAYLPMSALNTTSGAPLRLKFNGTTSITTIAADDVDADAAYNVLGQKVNNNYKGVVVKNGRKMIVR